jgi:hypothetical protein
MGVIENGIYDAHFQPCARVYHNANQTTTTAVSLALAFNSERFDTDAIHDTVTNNTRLTCKTAGKYFVLAEIIWVANATGTRVVQLRLNGSQVIGEQRDPSNSAGDTHAMSAAAIWDLAVNDYIEAMATQTSGGNLNVNSVSGTSPEFMMTRVG